MADVLQAAIEDGQQAVWAGGFAAAPVVLRITSTSNGLPAALTDGKTYRMSTTEDCYVRQCKGTMTAATGNAYLIYAGTEYLLPVYNGFTNVVAITTAASGYLYIQSSK